MDLSPFHEDILMTSGLDGHCKLWRIPEYVFKESTPLKDTHSTPELDLEGK